MGEEEEFENMFSVKIYEKDKIDKQIKGQHEIIRGLKNGIIETFLQATDVHEGRVVNDPSCILAHKDEGNLIGIEKTCNIENDDTKDLVQAKVMSKEVFQDLYSDKGRNVVRKECVFYSTNLQENVGLVSFTSVELSLIAILDVTEGNEETVIGDALKKEAEIQDKEAVINKAQTLLIKIQKSGAVTAEGSKAFLTLVSTVKSISKENSEAFLTKFKTKKV